MDAGTPIAVTCPDCRGPMLEVQDGGLTQFRCIVGHSYSARSFLTAHSETQENALWAAAVALKESANLVKAVAPELPAALARRLEEQAAKKVRQAEVIARILEELERFEVE